MDSRLVPQWLSVSLPRPAHRRRDAPGAECAARNCHGNPQCNPHGDLLSRQRPDCHAAPSPRPFRGPCGPASGCLTAVGLRRPARRAAPGSRCAQCPGRLARFAQHPDERRRARPGLLAVDQHLGEGCGPVGSPRTRRSPEGSETHDHVCRVPVILMKPPAAGLGRIMSIGIGERSASRPCRYASIPAGSSILI